jgi:hypothetical protein
MGLVEEVRLDDDCRSGLPGEVTGTRDGYDIAAP